MFRAAVIVGVLSGCAYRPGTFAYGPALFAGEKATIGCVDIAVERRKDHDKSAVLAYQFGNRCDKAQLIDFANARVIGRDETGGEHAMRPFDPRLEIKPMPIDARLVGKEAIAYVPEEPGADIVQICVDAASIVRGQKEHWMCFAREIEPPPPEPEPVGAEGDPSIDEGEQSEEVALIHEGDL